MTKIESAFSGVMVCQGDIWVADYTEQTKGFPKCERKGVTIQEMPFVDIAAFICRTQVVRRFLQLISSATRDFFRKECRIVNVCFVQRTLERDGFCFVS